MSSTDQFQALFDSAMSGLPASAPPSPTALHHRLHRQRVTSRLSTASASVVALVVTVTGILVGLPGSETALTLVPAGASSVSVAQLKADQRVMTARLHAIGYPRATITVKNGTLYVTNGPSSLSGQSEYLTTTPEITIREVLCYADTQSGTPATGPLPTTCSSSSYAAPRSTPVSSNEFTMPHISPDPTLTSYPSTSPAADAASPGSVALLPLTSDQGVTSSRLLVGPVLAALTPKVASASVADANGWTVTVHLVPDAAATLDRIARQYFHGQLAFDLNGVVASDPIIEPTSQSFVSFHGLLVFSVLSRNDAYDLSAALTSGPLAVPLTESSPNSK